MYIADVSCVVERPKVAIPPVKCLPLESRPPPSGRGETMGRRVSEMGVFGWDQVIRSEAPLAVIAVEEAETLIDKGLAKYCNKNRSIQLLEHKRVWDWRGVSCSPKDYVIHAAAEGKPWAVAIIQAWQPAFAVTPFEWAPVAPEETVFPAEDADVAGFIASEALPENSSFHASGN